MSQATMANKSDVVRFVRDFAAKQKLQVTIHDDAARSEDEWLYLPMHATGPDAYERADRLQRIEDAWNRQRPLRLPHLMIVPTKD